MSSIRKREWTTPSGQCKVAWLVDYRDPSGNRRFKQFARKSEAQHFENEAGWDVRRGTHTAESQSITVAAAGALWLTRARREHLEPATIDSYEQHVRLHIEPFLGARRLNQLTKPIVESCRDDLLDSGRSRAMVSRVLRSLASLVGEAERLGYVGKNVCRGVSLRRSHRGKLRPVIPSKAELRQLINAAAVAGPGAQAMMLILVFAGLRASELRALPWRSVDLKRRTITVDQRADKGNVIGPPKSASGWRTIPVPEVVVSGLREWKLRCPASALDLVFPSRSGTPHFHPNLVLRFLEPAQLEAGAVRPALRDGKPVFDNEGRPIVEGRYTLHCLRHAAASLWIEQRVEPKRIQTWMGHHSIQVTFDTYGHLFAALENDAEAVAAIAREVMAC